jgi:glyoxylase-like metal-dependent hydrolase (beta-lactamase superfamily II)
MAGGRYSIGHLRVDVLSDGYFLMDAGAIFGIVPRILWEPIAGPPDERNRLRIPVNCLLVRGGGRTVLIDSGIGTKIPPERRETAYPGDYGHLLGGLAALGVRPPDVDVVVNSHLHFDHCGWNTALVHGAAIPTFPNARYYIQRGEWEAATHPNERTRATYLSDNILPLAESGQLELVEGERQVTGEVRLVPAPGHTEAHCTVVISAGGETAVYIGDLVQHAAQLERTAWVTAFDVLPLVSMETKKRVVAEALRTGALLLSPHIPYPGAGRLHEVEGRPRFVPVPGLDD